MKLILFKERSENMKDIQVYQWGSIQWLTDQRRATSEILDIGLVTIEVGGGQEKHIHYGDEQYVYVLEGQGISYVDGVESALTRGSMLYIPAGAVHETRNTGHTSLLELIISYPKELDQLWDKQVDILKSANGLINVSEDTWLLSEDEIDVLTTYTKSLALPIALYGTKGQPLYSNGAFPRVCCDLCHIDEDIKNCHLYEKDMYYSSPAYSEQTAYYCKYGLAVLDTPVIVGHQMIGHIRGGHLLLEDDFQKIHPKVAALSKTLAKIPKGRLRIILTQYKKMAEQLSYDHSRRLSAEKKDASPVKSDQSLKEDLDLALGKLLNLQINNHFLFNTLNAIAGLSIEEGGFKTYEAIINLSKLFRYSLRNVQEFVPLSEEVDYIRQYLDLQKIRFGDRLSVSFEIEDKSLKCYVPFSTLQPLIENAFVHGFRDYSGQMSVVIKASVQKETLTLEIMDNGMGIDGGVKEKLLSSIREGSLPRHGLALVYDRLGLFFGQDIELSISDRSHENKQGTCIKVILPKRLLQEGLLGG